MVVSPEQIGGHFTTDNNCLLPYTFVSLTKTGLIHVRFVNQRKGGKIVSSKRFHVPMCVNELFDVIPGYTCTDIYLLLTRIK